MGVELLLEKIQISEGKNVDPAALLMFTCQVRNLLRFHQSMGLTGYPGRAELAKLFCSQGDAGMMLSSLSPLSSKNRKTTPRKTTILETPKIPTLSLSHIQQEIKKCHRCSLGENRLGQVIGNNPQRAKLMVVGDWSHQIGGKDDFSLHTLMGREEDTMLWKMMNAIGLGRESVFVTNVVKCCPTGAGVGAESVRLCRDYLGQEIASVRPEIILAMGTVAARVLVDKDAEEAPIVSLRGRFYPCRWAGCKSIRVMVSFHPCFLVENTEMKKMAWQDLQMVQRQLSIS